MKPATSATSNYPKDIIFARQLPLGVRRSAWWLYLHELNRIDIATGKAYTPRKALQNVLAWMDEQQVLLERVKQSPTQMQLRLIQMLADGKSQKQIAYELGKNVQTTRLHFTLMRRRLGVHTLYQLVAIGVKRGWIKVNNSNNRTN